VSCEHEPQASNGFLLRLHRGAFARGAIFCFYTALWRFAALHFFPKCSCPYECLIGVNARSGARTFVEKYSLRGRHAPSSPPSLSLSLSLVLSLCRLTTFYLWNFVIARAIVAVHCRGDSLYTKATYLYFLMTRNNF